KISSSSLSVTSLDPSPTVPPDSSDGDHARPSLSHRASNTLGPTEEWRWDTRWEDSPDRSVPPKGGPGATVPWTSRGRTCSAPLGVAPPGRASSPDEEVLPQ